MAIELDITKKYPHKRKNILTGEWVLVSPQRTNRPWQGKVEKLTDGKISSFDPDCYLCPGNRRASGEKNPDYQSTFVFENDFSSLIPLKLETEQNEFELLISKTENGCCRVICYSPNHNLTMAGLNHPTILKVIDTWIAQFEELSKIDYINYITIFENKGEMMGCSNPHPHGQIWAQNSIPIEAIKETENQKKYYKEKKYCLLCDYLIHEKKKSERVIFENDCFAVVVPFWAIWPFETIIIPKRHDQNILKLDGNEKKLFAETLKTITTLYDKIFSISFPYSMGFHQAPTDGKDYKEWHWHLHFYPPLLRSAAVKKFMVGYEMLAMPQRDFTPEEASKLMKNLNF